MTSYEPTIYISTQVERELKWFAKNYDKEMAAIGEVEMLKNGDMYIPKVYYPDQINGGATVSIDTPGWMTIYKECPTERRPFLKCHIHKHPGQMLSFSGTDDEDTIDSFMERQKDEKDKSKGVEWQRDFYIFIVFIKKDDGIEFAARIELRANPITATIENVEVKVMPEKDNKKIKQSQSRIRALEEQIAKEKARIEQEEEKTEATLKERLEKIKEERFSKEITTTDWQNKWHMDPNRPKSYYPQGIYGLGMYDMPQPQKNDDKIVIMDKDFDMEIGESSAIIICEKEIAQSVEKKIKEWDGGLVDKNRCQLNVKTDAIPLKYAFYIEPRTQQMMGRLKQCLLEFKPKKEDKADATEDELIWQHKAEQLNYWSDFT